MGQATVRSHTRRGYQVKAHARHTSGHHIADILQRDLDRVFERIDQQGATEQISSANPDCLHPGWYPVLHVDGTRILAYACTDCAATKPAEEGQGAGAGGGRRGVMQTRPESVLAYQEAFKALLDAWEEVPEDWRIIMIPPPVVDKSADEEITNVQGE